MGEPSIETKRTRWIRWAAAATVGAVLALMSSRADPLALRRGEELPKIERKETANAQYSYAFFLNTEEGWQAVLDYYPEDGENGGPRQRYTGRRRLYLRCRIRW